MKKYFHFSTRRFLLATFALCLLFPAKAQEFISGGIAYYVTDSYNMTAEVAYQILLNILDTLHSMNALHLIKSTCLIR